MPTSLVINRYSGEVVNIKFDGNKCQVFLYTGITIVKFSVYIATSVDGFIAREDGSIDWLESSGNPQADMGDNPDMGFGEFISSVDCIIMGRKTMETLSGFDLTPEQWPYKDVQIIALSNTRQSPPDNLKDRVEMHSGDIPALIDKLEQQGHRHAYIDGGKTIQTFLRLKLINEMTITRVPVLLGKGKPLFGETAGDIKLEKAQATVFANDFVQLRYQVDYS